MVKPVASADAAKFLKKLGEIIGTSNSMPATTRGTPTVVVHSDLRSVKFVFIHRGIHRTPIQNLYDCSFKVLEVDDETFKLEGNF